MRTRDAKRLMHRYLWEGRVKGEVTAVCFVHNEWDAVCMACQSQSCSYKQQLQAAVTSSDFKG